MSTDLDRVPFEVISGAPPLQFCKTYGLERDCSFWTGPTRHVPSLSENVVVAGSADGAKVFVSVSASAIVKGILSLKGTSGAQPREIEEAASTIVDVGNSIGAKLLRVQIFAPSGSSPVSAILAFDRDVYTTLLTHPGGAHVRGTPSPNGGMLLLNAATAGDSPLVRKLLAEGADPNVRNPLGWTPLMLAAAEKHADTVVALLEARADTNARNAQGRTALMFAAIYGQDAIVERLLASGADPNLVPGDETGWSALIAAAARGHANTVAALLRGGADPAVRSKDGKTALDMARGEGHQEVVKVLEATVGR